MKKALCSAVILLLLSLASYQALVFAMTSANYQVPTIVSGGGGGTSGSSGYSVTGMIGQSVIGGASSDSYNLDGGFWNDITQDTTPPTGSISIASGAASINSTSATLTLSCTDASGCSEMQFSNDNTNWSTAEAYATSKAWTLTTGDGTKTVYVKFKDTAGNWSTATISDTIVLDTTAPITTASPAGGTYTSAQSVTLICSDGTGVGCDKIYYTTDGSTPTTLSTVYTTPITIFSTTTLKFFAKDLAGNGEAVKTQAYSISGGVAKIWGRNEFGQLGDGTTTDKTIPVQVSGLTGVTSIAGGGDHTIVLKSDGTVWIWGRNYSNQLGDGTATDRPTPAQVNGLTGVTSIAGGGDHTIVLKSDETVWAWGNNGSGQLGDGTMTNRPSPVQVSGLIDVTAIAGGADHTIALKNDGTVWAWGSNWSGQLGDGTTTDRPTPGQVSGLTGVTAIAGGGDHTIALKNDGTVWAWGSNYFGGLGDGTTTDRPTPGQVSGLTGVTAIAGGDYHTIALKNDGTVWAWGQNSEGQLGDGTITDRLTPVQVSGLTGVTAIAGGDYHTIVLKNDGTVRAWGRNTSGQLGDGTMTNRPTPVQVSGLTWVTAITGGGNHTIAIVVPDTTAPTGTISINSGAASTNSTSATMTLSCTDASGCSEMQFSNDNTTWSTAEAYATSKTWTLLSGDGTKTVYVKFKDTAGNWSTATISDTIVLDTTAPTTTASPAGGTYTSAQSVTLSCSDGAGSGCDKIYYTTDGSIPTTSSAVYSTPISISATTTLKFFSKDFAGNSEAVRSEAYTIDTTAPTGTISINSGATSTNTTSTTLTLSCTDTSGCSEMQFSNDNTNWSTAEAYGTTKAWTLASGDATKTVYVKFKDTAGNWSTATISDTIALDTTSSSPTSIEVSNAGVKGELVIYWMNSADSDFSHIHIYRSTASGTLGTLVADNITGIKYTDTGLASYTTYYYTVRAVDTLGNESTNTTQYSAKTSDATPPAAPTGATATDAATGGKINLSWTNPADSDFSMINIYRSTASGTLGSTVFIGLATSYSDTGLTNGTTYYYTVRAVDTSSNETTNTTQVSATPTAPDATPPSVPTTGGTPVVDTTAGGTLTISWTNPTDSDFAFVRIYRSTTSGQLGSLVYDNVTGTSKTDTGLTNNATYYYTIRSVDTSGNESTNTAQVSGIPTDIQAPASVTGLTATLLSSGRIKLDWTRSSSPDVNAYNIYYDNGAGTIDYTYANKIGTVQHPTTTWTSGSLSVGTAYKFAVRAEDLAQNEDASASVMVSAVPVTDPNAGDVRGYIKVPQTGQKIGGNMVTVVADLLTGAAADVKDMRFQYKPASSGSWTDITPADANFPNPDTTQPWFIHWDVTALASGDYLIRAVATNVNLSTDATPAYITVTVDNTAPDVSSSANQVEQSASASTTNQVVVGTDTGVTQLTIPESALSTDATVTVTAPDPATKNSLVPSDYGKADEFREITLDSGQTSLSNDKEAELIIPYSDDNNDNIVDGTATKVYDLKVMRYNTTTSSWEKLDSVVDTTNKTVKGKTDHFTLFGLLAPPNPTTPGWNLVSVPLYPSPNSASSVFGQTPYVYNPATNGYDRPSTISPGTGYWIKGGANLTASGTETPTTGDFSITLKKGWNMIGNPFRFNVRLSDVKVSYNAVDYTMTDAETNGILLGTAYPYVNGVYQYVNASDGGEMEPWAGYWVLADKDCTLLVPPTPAQ